MDAALWLEGCFIANPAIPRNMQPLSVSLQGMVGLTELLLLKIYDMKMCVGGLRLQTP